MKDQLQNIRYRCLNQSINEKKKTTAASQTKTFAFSQSTQTTGQRSKRAMKMNEMM